MKLNQRRVQHLFLRAGFGDDFETISQYIGDKPDAKLKAQWKQSFPVTNVNIGTGYTPPYQMKMASQEEKQAMAKQGREDIKTLNTNWIKEMSGGATSFNEKMAFFWHDHFACRSNSPLFTQDYLDVLRNNALGNFGHLLSAVSKTPAMLQYLNNQQNKKSSPNENFAREVMELFTLGRDQGYTEKDISEAARAFTGWGFNDDGFVERKKIHDLGTKTFLGETGTFTGDDIIEILLKQKQTAQYISQKWVRFFVHPDGNKSLEEKVAEVFYESNYDIKCGLSVIFTSKEFYQEENIGSRIKSPIELIVGIQRQLGVLIEDEQSLLYLQRMLGQMLFNPPNVSGWPDGKAWVDSATLLFRLNLPELIFKSAAIQNLPEASFDDNDQFQLKGQLKKLQTSIDLGSLETAYRSDRLSTFILQLPTSQAKAGMSLLDQVVYYSSKPEYQLC